MTSAPASRRAMATTLMPRSCPSRPGLARSTLSGLTVTSLRGLTTGASPQVSLGHDAPAVEFQRGVAHHAVQVRDGVDLAPVGNRVAQGDMRGAAGRLGLHRDLADGPGGVEGQRDLR